jgi:hypothetical protein
MNLPVYNITLSSLGIKQTILQMIYLDRDGRNVSQRKIPALPPSADKE